MALLQRLRDPELGRITLDGRDLRRIKLASLRAATAVVFQDAGLFNRSIADNLRLAKPEASDRELEAALATAEALDFVRQKPGGLDYVIGERGQLLSGGERQRLAIARAILKDAPLLLLDEATSALDTVTEAKVKAALDRARRGGRRLWSSPTGSARSKTPILSWSWTRGELWSGEAFRNCWRGAGGCTDGLANWG